MSEDTAVAAPEAPRAKPAKKGGFWRELPVLLVVALVLALLIKGFLVQAFYIPSGSMEQTLMINDRVLVNKLVYDFRDVRRGEIIVFDADGSLAPDADARTVADGSNPVSRALKRVSTTLGFGVPPGEQDYIKRVIGLPGDRVACCDAQGRVTVTPPGGTPVALDEPYVFENTSPQVFCAAGATADTCPVGAEGVLVPPGRLFVMGDHRSASSDSRIRYRDIKVGGTTDDGNNGTIPEDEVIGRAFVTVWPVARFDWLGTPGTFDGQLSALGVASAPYAAGALGVLPLGLWRRRRCARA